MTIEELDRYYKIQDFVQVKHAHQYDKAGSPYIFHLLGVASILPDHLKVLGLGHDLLEDTDTTLDELFAAGFTRDECSLLLVLTHRKNETYRDYIHRVASISDTKYVKLADLTDNLSRLATLPEDSRLMLKFKYWDALQILMGVAK